jgi:Family of unknown function (DUF6510)
MAGAEMMLDGNAIAGTLGEIFVSEMTTSGIVCGSCGRMEPMGAEHVYMQAPGMVVRCCHCEDVLLVVTRMPGRHLLGFRAATRLEVAAQD